MVYVDVLYKETHLFLFQRHGFGDHAEKREGGERNATKSGAVVVLYYGQKHPLSELTGFFGHTTALCIPKGVALEEMSYISPKANT